MTTTQSTETRTVKTSELRVGDVVLTHGMRVRIDSIKSYKGSTGLPAASCSGTVLNLAEVLEEGYVPASFLRTRKSEGYSEDRDDFWNVQGNDLATWQVEVPLPAPQHRNRFDNLTREAAIQLLTDHTKHLTSARIDTAIYRAGTQYEAEHFSEGYVSMAEDGHFDIYLYEAAAV